MHMIFCFFSLIAVISAAERYNTGPVAATANAPPLPPPPPPPHLSPKFTYVQNPPLQPHPIYASPQKLAYVTETPLTTTTRKYEPYPSFEIIPPRKDIQAITTTTTKTATTTITTTPKHKSRPGFDTEYNYPERNLPLKACFYNEHGYACCSKALQNKMEEVANRLLNNDTFHRCNVQKLANDLQKELQSSFGDDFESVVGLSDYAERIHFRKTYVCKIEIKGRYILAYATPNEMKELVRNRRGYTDVHEYNF